MENTSNVADKLGTLLDQGYVMLFQSLQLAMLKTVLETAYEKKEIDLIEYEKESKWIREETVKLNSKLKEIKEEGEFLNTLASCGILELQEEEA
jgi:hypothetical protein